jgi:hypothetical protein
MKFFQKTPRKGLPFSMAGIAEGLRKIAYALENIQVANGHVEWTALGAPRIYFDGTTAAAGLEAPDAGGGSGGGVPSGFEEIENAVVFLQVDSSSGTDKLQVKYGTVLAKDVDETWTDLLVPEAFDA